MKISEKLREMKTERERVIGINISYLNRKVGRGQAEIKQNIVN
jgi:hypothetical protein